MTLVMSLALFCGAVSAQIAPADIQFWVGSGDGEAVVTVIWSTPDTGLAWGVRYDTDEGLDPLSALAAIADGDSRFSYTVEYQSFTVAGISALNYNDGTSSFSLATEEHPCVYVDEVMQADESEWDMVWCDDVDGTITFAADCYLVYTHVGAVTQGEAPEVPVDATIAFEDIRYWVGEGSDSAVLIVNFGNPDTAFAWGYLFNGTATVQQMTDAITAADPRFWVVDRPSYYPDGDIFFVISTGDTLSLSGRDEEYPYNYWEANINGGTSNSGNEQELVNGDVFKYGDQRAPSRVCLQESGGWCLLSAWTKEPTPVSEPIPEDAEIAASEIVYWVGEGDNKVVFAINWADTALAWGYKFSTDSVYVSEIIGAIVRTDPRLNIEGDSTFVSDFVYADANITDSLHITPHDPMDWSIYFNMQVNHVSSMIGAGGHKVGNGDFVKFADTYVAVKADSTWIEGEYSYWDYTYVYPMEIHPVSVPQNVGISGVEAVSVMVWPNPTTSLVNVSVSRPMQAELYDLAGRQVAAYSFAEGSNKIDLSALQNGVYMLRAEGSVSKIVKR